MGLVARVLGEVVEAGAVDGDRLCRAAVELDRDLARALDGREGAAGLVGDGQRLAVLAGGPGPLPGAAGEELGARRHHPGAGARRSGAAARSAPAARAGRRSRAARPGSPPRSRRIRPRRSGTRRGRRRGSRGRGWASPRSRRSARGRARRRSRPGTRPRAGQAGRDRRRVGAEREARRLDADRPQARVAVAAVPLGEVGERPHAVELGEVEEVDEGRPAGGEDRHRLRLLADPGHSLRAGRGRRCCLVRGARAGRYPGADQ